MPLLVGFRDVGLAGSELVVGPRVYARAHSSHGIVALDDTDVVIGAGTSVGYVFRLGDWVQVMPEVGAGVPFLGATREQTQAANSSWSRVELQGTLGILIGKR